MLIPIAIALIVFVPIVTQTIALMTIEFTHILFFLLIVLAISGSVYWEFLPTFVQFNRSQFSIYKRCFGFTMTTITDSTAEIEDVFYTMKTFRNGKTTYETRVVTIQTYRGEYFFAKGMSRNECSWLVNAIQYWLDLR
jgi:hypothetical protein